MNKEYIIKKIQFHKIFVSKIFQENFNRKKTLSQITPTLTQQGFLPVFQLLQPQQQQQQLPFLQP
jgi:hypothetical protein